MEKGFSYDDVLIQPRKTSVTDLSNVDISVKLGSADLELPVISAPMDTVTEEEMAESIGDNGGLGVIHRFMPAAEQAKIVSNLFEEDVLVGAAVGLQDFDRAEKLVENGVDYLVLDIAHGHHEKLLDEVERYDREYDVDLIAGNVATKEGAKDLEKAGADVVKVGIGPGSACTTREMTGAGVPQFTAVKRCAESVEEADIIADGGIKKPGDLAKALMAGASAGMIGGMFAGTSEAPGRLIEKNGEKYKAFRGMSSEEAAEKRAERTGREINYEDRVPEGVNTEIKFKGSVENIFNRLKGGLRSSVSYCGAKNLSKARENVEFIQITEATQLRNSDHI